MSVVCLSLRQSGYEKRARCTLREIQMIMRATCHHEVCGTCSQEEGSLHNPHIKKPSPMVFLKSIIVGMCQLDLSSFNFTGVRRTSSLYKRMSRISGKVDTYRTIPKQLDSSSLIYHLSFGGACLDHLSGHPPVQGRYSSDSNKAKRTQIQLTLHQHWYHL